MNRTYNNGKLTAYEVTKEMKARGKRNYYKVIIRDTAQRVAIVLTVGAILTAVYLIAN